MRIVEEEMKGIVVVVGNGKEQGHLADDGRGGRSWTLTLLAPADGAMEWLFREWGRGINCINTICRNIL
jgi:hypothetical protein